MSLGSAGKRGPLLRLVPLLAKAGGMPPAGDGGRRGQLPWLHGGAGTAVRGEDGQASRQNVNTALWSPFAQLGQRRHYDERSHRDQFQVLFGGLGNIRAQSLKAWWRQQRDRDKQRP